MSELKIKPATGEPHSLAGMLEQAFEQLGTSMMSDDFAAKLLAYCYVIGDEACVLHKGLNAGLMMAQQKANIYGGCVPNWKIVKYMQIYIKDLERTRDGISKEKMDGGEMKNIVELLPWVKEIFVRYELGLPGKGKFK